MAQAHLAITQQEIDDWLNQLRLLALRYGMQIMHVTNSVGVTQLMVITLPGVNGADTTDSLLESIDDPTLNDGAYPDAEAFVSWMRQALLDLHDLKCLSSNMLTRQLDLSAYRQKDPPHTGEGMALKRAIRASMDLIAVQATEREIELVRCYRERFEEHRTHAEIAANWNYSVKTIQRRERELCLRLVSELLFRCGRTKSVH
jgi:hypothetical protein